MVPLALSRSDTPVRIAASSSAIRMRSFIRDLLLVEPTRPAPGEWTGRRRFLPLARRRKTSPPWCRAIVRAMYSPSPAPLFEAVSESSPLKNS